MNQADDTRRIRRFLRTLRVATQTALAFEEFSGSRARSATTFSALAAKGAQDWRFPAAGVMSADGLVLARLLHENEATKVLALQAQGAAGLSTYAERAIRLRLTSGDALEGVFDRDGQLHILLDAHLVREPDLAAFEIEFEDTAP